MGHCSPLHWTVAAESKAGLTVDVLRVADIRAVIALIYGHIYSRSFRVRLQNLKKKRESYCPDLMSCFPSGFNARRLTT